MHIENYLFLYIVKSTSVDDDRASISLKAVNEYIDAVLNALKQVTDLRLLLNMDESGFGRRPENKKGDLVCTAKIAQFLLYGVLIQIIIIFLGFVALMQLAHGLDI